MKKYKKYLISVFLIATMILWNVHFTHSAEKLSVEHIMQVVTADMKHERKISWQMKNYSKPTYLEVRKKGEQEGLIKSAIGEDIPSSQEAGQRIYTVWLQSLESGKEYEYRILVEDWQSNWKSFRTEPENIDSFKVLVFGDSQSINYEVWGKTAQIAWAENKDAAFFINVGDLVDNGQRDREWQAWFSNAGELLESVPFSPVMGNHETYGIHGFAIPKTYLTLFSLPLNGADHFKKHAYSYDYGDVHFVVLNTQQGELRNWYPNLLEEQKIWLMRDLANTKKKWKVILMHRGAWTNGSMNEIGQVFGPVFDGYHVDVVFSGHTHIYARTRSLKDGKSDSTGTVYITTGRSGTKSYPQTVQQSVDDVFYNPVDMPNYLILKMTNDSLQIESYKQNQVLIDQIEIRK